MNVPQAVWPSRRRVGGGTCTLTAIDTAVRAPHDEHTHSACAPGDQSNFTYRVTLPDMFGLSDPTWPEQSAER